MFDILYLIIEKSNTNEVPFVFLRSDLLKVLRSILGIDFNSIHHAFH